MIDKKSLGAATLIAAMAGAALPHSAIAGPLVTAGGKAATTVTKYEVNVKAIEFRRSDGTFAAFFSSAGTPFNIAGVGPNSTAGAIGAGSSLSPGTYNGVRITLARTFVMNGSATAVGPGGGNCATGGATDTAAGGYTLQLASVGVVPVDRVFTIPPEADALINAVPGLSSTAAGFQLTVSFSPFTVAANQTVPPDIDIKFDVTKSLEFLHNGANCIGLVLPPTVTVTTPNGTMTYNSPI